MNDEQKARVIANCEVIAKALRDGRSVQYFNHEYAVGGWCNGTLKASMQDLDIRPHLEYRLKPEPRTIWVNEYSAGGPAAVHDTAAEARQKACHNATRIAVEYREVTK